MDGAIERIGHLRFRQGPAPPSAVPAVSSVWRAVAETETTLRLVPDRFVELVRSADGTVQVFGPATRWRDVHLAAGAEHDGVRLRCGRGAAILGCDQRDLVNRVVPAEVLDLPTALGRDLDRDYWFAALWTWLAQQTDDAPDALIDAAAELLARPGARVGDVARSLGVGERRLHRVFQRHTGLSPTAYRRLARINATVTRLESGQETIADITHRCGFADQAHLGREMRELTGQTPGAFTPALRDLGLRNAPAQGGRA